MRNVLALACCALVVLAFAAPALAQADNQTENPDPCQGTMDIDTCMFGDDGGSGGGSGSGGCQYCYWNDEAPYANCFSATPGLPYSQYSNCVGTQMCWSDGSGGQICQPLCTGNACHYA
jgi:hypothetical protein